MPVELEAIYLKLNPCPGVPETEDIILSLATRPSWPCGFRFVGFASPAFTGFAFFSLHFHYTTAPASERSGSGGSLQKQVNITALQDQKNRCL
jgi:hypothetical protein